MKYDITMSSKMDDIMSFIMALDHLASNTPGPILLRLFWAAHCFLASGFLISVTGVSDFVFPRENFLFPRENVSGLIEKRFLAAINNGDLGAKLVGRPSTSSSPSSNNISSTSLVSVWSNIGGISLAISLSLVSLPATTGAFELPVSSWQVDIMVIASEAK